MTAPRQTPTEPAGRPSNRQPTCENATPLPYRSVLKSSQISFAGLAYRQSLVWQNTESLFRNVLRHYPQSYVAHANIANAYRRRDDLDSAITEFKAALIIRPHARTYANLGAVYRKQKKYIEAQQQYDLALDLDPNSKEAHLGQGLLYAETGRLPEAEMAYLRAIDVDTGYEEAYVNLGVLQDKLGRSEEAVASLEKAIGLNPFLQDAHYNLAVIYTKLRRYDEAITSYERAIALAPNVIPARINLALLYLQRGDREAAVDQFRMVLRIDPGNAAARSALGQLGETL